jgi:asparagine synthase (glutamine-hydrolysing)
LRESFEAAVSRQLMSDAPYGVLLSGGLDSSLTSAVAKRLRPDAALHSFAIGLADSQDLPKARLAAEAIGSIHHELTFSLDEGFNALSDVIYHIESYDLTTVRASVPMYLLARRIKASGIKMVLTGEGADEIFGGYLYFHKAPNAYEFHAETVRKLDTLHKFDCLRANKTLAAWGIEARVPFLDLEFLQTSMSIDSAHKMCEHGRIEKTVLREAFAGVLPDDILWRQKEQFSDGVGYSWIDGLKAFAEIAISDEQFRDAPERFRSNPPSSKEGYLYRQMFSEHFPSNESAVLVPGGLSIACSSSSAISWDKAFAGHADPSGRAVRGVHQLALRTAPPARATAERQLAQLDTSEADA